jgi:hypothetical protein
MITANLTGNLGNHMWNYVIARLVAEKRGFEWGVPPHATHDYHSGANQMYFMDVDFGKPLTITGKYPDRLNIYDNIERRYSDENKSHTYNGDSCCINMYDSHVFEVEDNTMIHIISQSEDYLTERRDDILDWFKIKPEFEQKYLEIISQLGLNLDENLCVINFRGGEFRAVPNLIPNQNYWQNSIRHMKNLNPNMNFIIITDDTQCASMYIPGLKCLHIDIGFDFYMVNKSKYLIMTNSSFSWWAGWLNQDAKLIIAPKYFGRHNVSNGYWSLGDSYTSTFHYMDRDGNLTDYDTCKAEALEFYKKNNII